jgi:hypothetical protein
LIPEIEYNSLTLKTLIGGNFKTRRTKRRKTKRRRRIRRY